MRPYRVMVAQDDGKAQMYETKDTSMHKAISSIEQIHSLQYPSGQFRVVYIEEIIQ